MEFSTSRRSTRQRRLILDEIKRSKFHPSAEDIYNSVRKKLPRISLGTVYRNLELLCNEGAIFRVDNIDSKRRYDHVDKPHYHVVCLKCEKIEDIYPENYVKWSEEIGKNTDFKISRHDAVFYGICGKCQSQINSKSN